jgi:peptidyl-prolyl cis-trans isomerase C
MHFNNAIGCRLLAAACLAFAPSLFAQALQPPPLDEHVVARRGGVELTLFDIDVRVRTLPPDLRAGYMTESDRASRMINSTMLSKQLAKFAEEQKIDQRHDFIAELALARTELLSRYALEQHLAEATLPNVETLAQERYLADPAAFRPRPRIDVSHILIATDGREEADAKALADEALARVRAGEDFLELAQHYGGEDAGIPTIQNLDFTRMDPKFSRAVGELKKPGDITGPVRTQFGYHVIRLDVLQEFPIPPYEKIKEPLIKELLAAARDKIKNDFLGSFSKLPTELNDAAVQSLKERYLPGGEADVSQPLKPDPTAGG